MRIRACLFVASILSAAAAWADQVEVSLDPKALIGQGVPTLNVHIVEPIAGFEVKLKRSDGKDVLVRGGGRPGDVRKIQLTQPEGKLGYKGELSVNLPNGSTSSMPLEFDAELFGPLRMKLEKEDVDLENRKLTFRLSRPAGKAHLKVLMDTGRVAMDDDVLFIGEPADTPLELTWPTASGRVMRIDLQAYDTSTFFTGVELYPWQVDIPHEEVSFDTAKWDIRPVEQPKLDKSLSDIQEAVSKYGRLAEIKLYVAGHTDTQGGTSYNRGLSLNRARSIGAYFRRKGLRIPVFYEGFGEEALMVPTPDETDEQRNRRAEYIITIQPPVLKNPPFPPKWQRL
ncbi:MAG: OmpA family protein [Myxococcales bacterium]|nr:OmpA family protein [Myxococcales bacterium]